MNETPYANSLFEQPWWLDIVAPGQWREVAVKDKKENIIGRMAYVSDGKNVYMPKLTQTMGIWMADDVKVDYGRQKNIINKIFDQLKDLSTLQITLAVENQYVLPFRWRGFTIEPQFTYRLNDLSDCDLIYKNFNSTCKRHIKSAQKSVQLFYESNPQILWNMLNKTFEAQNRKNPMDEALVFRIIENCDKTNHGKYIEARDEDGNVHSCAYFVYDDSVCYYLLGGSDCRFKSSDAQSLILWEGIQFAAQHSAAFDFEGSMVEGIENFFRQFGGQCLPYYTVKKQSFLADVKDTLKPRVKRLIGYKI